MKPIAVEKTDQNSNPRAAGAPISDLFSVFNSAK